MRKANNLGSIPGIDHGFCSINDPAAAEEVFICKQIHSASVMEWQAGRWPTRSRPMCVDAPSPPYRGDHRRLPAMLFASNNGDRVAAVHGGWKGLQRGIIASTMQRFAAEGVAVDQLQVAIGPSIKPCCYEVSAAFIAEFQTDQGHLWQHRQAPWSAEQPAPLLTPEIAQPQARQAGSAWFDLSGTG